MSLATFTAGAMAVSMLATGPGVAQRMVEPEAIERTIGLEAETVQPELGEWALQRPIDSDGSDIDWSILPIKGIDECYRFDGSPDHVRAFKTWFEGGKFDWSIEKSHDAEDWPLPRPLEHLVMPSGEIASAYDKICRTPDGYFYIR